MQQFLNSRLKQSLANNLSLLKLPAQLVRRLIGRLVRQFLRQLLVSENEDILLVRVAPLHQHLVAAVAALFATDLLLELGLVKNASHKSAQQTHLFVVVGCKIESVLFSYPQMLIVVVKSLTRHAEVPRHIRESGLESLFGPAFVRSFPKRDKLYYLADAPLSYPFASFDPRQSYGNRLISELVQVQVEGTLERKAPGQHFSPSRHLQVFHRVSLGAEGEAVCDLGNQSREGDEPGAGLVLGLHPQLDEDRLQYDHICLKTIFHYMYFPGDIIDNSESLPAGFGVSLQKGRATALLPGRLLPHSHQLSLAPLFRAEFLRKGVKTMCKVLKIREDQAWVQILMINEQALSQKLYAVITRQHIRQRLVDQLVMHQCFIPGDILKAQFLSFGDGRKVYLTTAKSDLGVVYALSKAGRLMVRVSDQEMMCMKSGTKQKRKCGWLDEYKQ